MREVCSFLFLCLSSVWFVLKTMPCVLKENMYWSVRWSILYISVRSSWVIVLRSVYLLILCLLVIIYWENSGEIFDYHCWFAYFFWLFEFCYMHFKALLVGVYTIKIVRSSWGIVSFNIMKYHTLSLMIFIVFKSSLPGMNIAV